MKQDSKKEFERCLSILTDPEEIDALSIDLDPDQVSCVVSKYNTSRFLENVNTEIFKFKRPGQAVIEMGFMFDCKDENRLIDVFVKGKIRTPRGGYTRYSTMFLRKKIRSYKHGKQSGWSLQHGPHRIKRDLNRFLNHNVQVEKKRNRKEAIRLSGNSQTYTRSAKGICPNYILDYVTVQTIVTLNEKYKIVDASQKGTPWFVIRAHIKPYGENQFLFNGKDSIMPIRYNSKNEQWSLTCNSKKPGQKDLMDMTDLDIALLKYAVCDFVGGVT